MKKTSQLKRLLDSSETEFILEAHNGLAARIVEEAGFRGIWASGLALSAQHAVRDNNELSWTQVVEALEFMSDATTIPILLDGDTGYGGPLNVQRMVRELIGMGARIILCDPHRAVVSGPSRLKGAELVSPDVRAGL